MEGVTIREHFACREDPRVERTRTVSATRYHHDSSVCRDLWGSYPGGHRRWGLANQGIGSASH